MQPRFSLRALNILGLACAELAFFTAGTSMAVDNTGTGGTIMYTDSSGLNPVASPPYVGGYVVHTFTNSGTYSNSYAVSADLLVVAGGGGGGHNPGNWEGSGGGAGGYLQENAALSAQSYTITVGAGGAVGNPAANGQPSSVVGTDVNVEAVGGGGGSGRAAPTSGGSGGGWSGGDGAPGLGTPGQGNAGGTHFGQSGAGGGGGADAQGQNGVSLSQGGNGGAGKINSLSGVSTAYAGGGGGGGWNQGTTTSSGGVGGGGNGGSGGTLAGTAGVDGTGGGGGGGGSSSAGGKGGSGIVIVRYPYAGSPVPFVITSITHDANNDRLTLVWNSNPGETYTIENATQFEGNGAGTSWDNLTTGIPSGGATTTKVIDAPSPGTYYRIRKE